MEQTNKHTHWHPIALEEGLRSNLNSPRFKIRVLFNLKVMIFTFSLEVNQKYLRFNHLLLTESYAGAF